MAISAKKNQIWLIRGALIAILFGNIACSGCSRDKPTPSVEPLNSALPTAAPTEVNKVEAPAPTAEANTVMLLASAENNSDTKSKIQATLQELADSSGMLFETRTELPQLEVGDDVRLVVLLPPDPGIANLAAANPQVQFLGVEINGLSVGSNISLITSGGDRSDQQGFLAGYLAAVITKDWRVGVISRADTVPGKAARQGFVNGAVFFCGLCRPLYPPFVQYPQFVELADGLGEAELRAAADQLLANAVKTVYIAPEAGDPFLLDYLSEAGVRLIGSASPKETLLPNWVATVGVDLTESLIELWPKLLNHEGGISASARLTLSDVNEELLSRGRMRLVEQTLNGLLAGLIDTGVDLQIDHE